jgi:hypothetical protein
MATLAPTPRLRGREVELQALGDTFDRMASGADGAATVALVTTHVVVGFILI